MWDGDTFREEKKVKKRKKLNKTKLSFADDAGDEDEDNAEDGTVLFLHDIKCQVFIIHHSSSEETQIWQEPWR